MLVRLNSFSIKGLITTKVDIEISISKRGFPSFDIVGLPNKVIGESRTRIKTAIINSGYKFPNYKIIVNLAPADVSKSGSLYDLPIAVGIISYLEGFSLPTSALFFGELSLDGTLRYTNGAVFASTFALESNFSALYLPLQCLNECPLPCRKITFGVNKLSDLINNLKFKTPIKNYPKVSAKKLHSCLTLGSFSNITGQFLAKRALQVSLAGGHHLLLIGSPGIGKTLLATASQMFLPSLTIEESIDVTKIYSTAHKLLPEQGLILNRPFRNPSPGISYFGMFGGSRMCPVGEISLSHCGVLFLDELPLFNKKILDALRVILDVGLADANTNGALKLPSNFIFIGAMNPCPCGYRGYSQKCVCTDHEIYLYRKKISEPLLDRIDMIVSLNSASNNSLSMTNAELDSDVIIQKSISSARELQMNRYSAVPYTLNSQVIPRDLSNFCPLSSECNLLINHAMTKYKFTYRIAHKLIKLARTLADLDSCNLITTDHISEALLLRGFDQL